MTSVLDLNHDEARAYFMEEKNYVSFDLPPYFTFQELLNDTALLSPSTYNQTHSLNRLGYNTKHSECKQGVSPACWKEVFNMAKGNPTDPNIRAEIVNKIRNEGVSAANAQYSVSAKSILGFCLIGIVHRQRRNRALKKPCRPS